MRNEALIKEVVLTFVSLMYRTDKRLFLLTFNFVRNLRSYWRLACRTVGQWP